MKKYYSEEIESSMLLYYSGLSEKDRRHYAALEAKKLDRGGKSYICNLFGLTHKTLRKGLRELEDSSLYHQIPEGKQRRLGGGRKKI